MSRTFTWLHLSDLHMGISTQDWLWPTLKHELFDDLSQRLDATGALDAVIFSGDLTQSASLDQFSKLDEALQELWSLFDAKGSRPAFFCVPGNHDLTRPSIDEPSTILLGRWWDEPIVQNGFWRSSESPYRKTVEKAFENFSTWSGMLHQKGYTPQEVQLGLLPGDFSASVDSSLGLVGLVGLNSSWLQLDGGDFEGRLLVHPKQLNAVTNDDPTGWCRQHALNILITHHPESWQHPESVATWRSEINPAGRFDLHVFGHMHVPDAVSHAHGGSPLRRSLQGASIFGLEKYGGGVQRLHGYSLVKVTDNASRELRVWPRQLIRKSDGTRKLEQDLSLCTSGLDSFVFPGAVISAIPSSSMSKSPALDVPSTDLSPGMLQGVGAAGDILGKVRRYIPRHAASVRVRAVEQAQCKSALTQSRAVWICADWGQGFDGFISTLQVFGESGSVKTYWIDAAQYIGRESFLAAIKEKFDFSFEAFCEALSGDGEAYLVLEDLPARQVIDERKSLVSDDVDSLVAVILEYCPKLRVILHSRQLPGVSNFSIVALKSLDEADLRAYVADHPKGGDQFSDAESIAKLFRHTDGVPALVDAKLRELEIIPIDQLASVNRDLNRIDASSSEVPDAIVKAVAEISSSDDPVKKRAYDLLQALSGFPQGETLERVKRFNGPYPFFPAHARELIDRSLLLTSSIVGEALGTNEPVKLLVVPRPVRDYIRASISLEDALAQNKRAAALYFGDKWKEGHIKPSIARRFENPVGNAPELANAVAILLRLVNDAITLNDVRAKTVALRIAATFISTVADGDHYTIVVTICRDILRELGDDDGDIDSAVRIRIAQAECTRMLGKRTEARDLLIPLSELPGSTSQRQDILLSLALAHQSLGESEDAVSIARKIVDIDKSSEAALQAQSIILEESLDAEARDTELRKHEARCRRRGAITAANNIAVSRAEETERPSKDVDESLQVVISSALKEKDFYNTARAIIKKVALSIDSGSKVSEKDKALLIDAYQYLFSERLRTCFDDCHESLWRLFESEGDARNLFRLFRHSSLIWRLRGEEYLERGYVERLGARITSRALSDVRNLEGAYFKVRADIVLPKLAVG